MTSAQMREYAAALERLAGTHRMFADWMDKEGISPLDVQNFKSATGAVDGLLSFLGAAGKAVSEALMSKSLEDLPDMFAAASTEPQARMALLALRKRRRDYLAKLLEQDRMSAEAEEQAGKILETRKEGNAGQNTGHANGKTRRKS